MAKVDTVTTIRAFDELRPVWDELLSESDFNTIFQTFEWQRAWWENFGEDHNLCILVVKSDGKAVGIAPLMQSTYSRWGRKGKTIRFIGSPSADYSDFIGGNKRQIVGEILRYFHEHRYDWTRIEFSQVSEKSATLPQIRDALESSVLRYRILPVETCMSYVFEGDDDARKDFMIKRNKTLRNYINFFTRTNGLTLELVRNGDEIASVLPGLFHSHVRRWEGSLTESKFRFERHRRFYHALAATLAPLDRLDLLVLKHGGEPLGYLLAFNYYSRIHLYTISNEPYYQRKSPGIILLHLLIERYVRDGFSEIDFARGVGTHKYRFVNSSSENFDIILFSGNFPYWSAQIYGKVRSASLFRKLIDTGAVRKFRTFLTRYRSSSRITGTPVGAIRWIARLLVNFGTTFLYEYRAESPAQPQPRIGDTVEKLTEENIESIAAFYGFIIDSEMHNIVRRRFAADMTCIALRRGTGMIGM
ncbi:MAG: GNAT family N-acetyltransferase, partial [Candidatus Zixiibacteriota bacterium]